MTEQRKLKELMNNVRITGVLKEMNLEVKQNKKDPSVKQIMGNIIVTSFVDNKVNEHRVELFAKESSKLFKGYDTIRKEYKAADSVGAENATRVTVIGSIDGNDYVGQDGQLREYNRIRGLFVNRLEGDAAANTQDEALAQIELVVTGVREKTDKEGIETGEYHIDGFTIGYNNSVIVLRDMIVGEDLANVITENYDENSTGRLTFNINNYVELEEKELEPDPLVESEGFGVNPDLSGTVKNYTRNLQVIGGFPPYLDERALEDEDILLAKQIRALKLQELVNNVPNTPPTGNGGFGSNADPFANDGKPVDISDEDLPF